MFALSDSKTVVAGVDSTTVMVGSTTRNVVAGAGISDTVGAGNYSATVGAGNLSLSVAVGTATIFSGILSTVSSTVMVNMMAPITKIGTAVVGSVVAGAPGPPSPHLDYLLGIPILGIPTVLIGP